MTDEIIAEDYVNDGKTHGHWWVLSDGTLLVSGAMADEELETPQSMTDLVMMLEVEGRHDN
jgi:hypothetical protein